MMLYEVVIWVAFIYSGKCFPWLCCFCFLSFSFLLFPPYVCHQWNGRSIYYVINLRRTIVLNDHIIKIIMLLVGINHPHVPFLDFNISLSPLYELAIATIWNIRFAIYCHLMSSDDMIFHQMTSDRQM